MRYDVDVRLARAGLREWRAGSVGDVWRAADVQLGCVALGEVAARTSACVPAPLYFGPPNSLNPWGNNRVATNIQIRDLQMFTTALQQRDVQQIMIGGRRRAELAVVDCGVFATCVASTGSFGVYECPAGGYCPPNSSAPTGVRARVCWLLLCRSTAAARRVQGARRGRRALLEAWSPSVVAAALHALQAAALLGHLHRSDRLAWCSGVLGVGWFLLSRQQQQQQRRRRRRGGWCVRACIRVFAGCLKSCSRVACVQLCVRRAATAPAQVRHARVCACACAR